MILVKFSGGLGNQMFQFALYTILKEKFTDEEIYADLSRYGIAREHEGFDLPKYFDIQIEKAPKDELRKAAPFSYILRFLVHNRFYLDKYVGTIEKIDRFLVRKNMYGVIPDYFSTNYNAMVFCLNRNNFKKWHYKGNWINPLYFKGYEEQIKRCFIFKRELLSEEDKVLLNNICKQDSVGIHIRQGDYLGNNQFALCKDDYYLKAVEKLLQLLAGRGKDIQYYIFTENHNIDYSYLFPGSIKIVSHLEMAGIDLWLLSKCKYQIIANSTFSYWAAYLNSYSEKIVIAPKYAYCYTTTLAPLPVPEEWIQIDNIDI